MAAAEQLRKNYVHQLQQTINAYLPSYIFIGEALQNALDAVRDAGSGNHKITVNIDFNARQVTVRDTGAGFPDNPALLFLGGGDKMGRGLAGMVGVGLKVVLFSSSSFKLQAKNANKAIKVELSDAHRFAEESPPSVELPDVTSLPEDQSTPFAQGTGTLISYTFPNGENSIPARFLRDLKEECLSPTSPNFATTLTNAANRGIYPNRLAALIASDLRRYTYVGSTEARNEFAKLTIEVTVTANSQSLGDLAEYADGKQTVTFEVPPSYLSVTDTLPWAQPPKPVITQKPLGDGGGNLERAKLAFNVTEYSSPAEYETLLINARGVVSPDIELFRRLLWPKLKSVKLTVGRIPQFQTYLPGGSRRVISARGVVTQHDIDVSSGQNQQYVRCFDLLINLDADLNYGKTQLTDMHLVANVRRFVNEAYRCTIQNAARNFVGTIKTSAEDSTDLFWDRQDLGVAALAQKRVPRDENDVIALMFELIGRGHFSDVKWYGLSSKDTYDARASFSTEPTSSDLKVVEFKLRGASVARDFDRDEKKPEEIDLVICYEVGQSPISTFQVVELANSETGRGDREVYPGVTHVLLDSMTGEEVQMLPLRTFIEENYSPAEPAPTPPDAEDTD